MDKSFEIFGRRFTRLGILMALGAGRFIAEAQSNQI
jgi:hypothetical protein